MSEGYCPKCNSENTRIAYENYIGRGLSVAIGVAATIFMPNTIFGKVGPIEAVKNITKEEGEIKKRICNDCGFQW